MSKHFEAGSFDTRHEDMIHDVEFDFYGHRLATCSSDGYIKIFSMQEDEPPTQLASFQGHSMAVLQVSWSHPKFGNLLASGGMDRKIIIWKELNTNSWAQVYVYEDQDGAAVNCLEWAPWEHGLILLGGSLDGFITVLSLVTEDRWESSRFLAHEAGVSSISWGPPYSIDENGISGPVKKRKFVSSGGDNLIKVWVYDETRYEPTELTRHTAIVRDVAWAPSIGLPRQLIASCSEDQTVLIWVKKEDGRWSSKEILKLQTPIWRVSWSVGGNILAVSAGDNITRIFKETPEGEWEVVNFIKDNGQVLREVGE